MSYLPSVATIIHTVIPDPVPDVNTSIVLTATPEPQEVSQDVTFLAVLSAADGTVPTGTVQFYIDDAPFGPLVALSTTTVTVDVPGNVLSIGDHPVAARYIP